MKILLLYQYPSPFVQTDLEILRVAHDVRALRYTGLGDLPALAAGIRWCDVAVCWMGKLHAFFSVVFSRPLRRKVAVISGGDDVTSTIVGGKAWGLYSHPVKRHFADVIFRSADLVLAVSEFNRREILRHTPAHPGRVKTVYHGFDPEVFRRVACPNRDGRVITVGHLNKENWHLKGFHLLAQTARGMPDTMFRLVGPVHQDNPVTWRTRMPENVDLPGGLYGEELVQALSQASVYVQLSVHESFCCAVAEAMLCECVPVVSGAGALPEVVGECGFYVSKPDPVETARKIRDALRKPEIGRLARQRIMELFSLEQRRVQLLEMVQSLVEF